MGKLALSKKEIHDIVRLRQKGYSLPEIAETVGRGRTTIFKYIQNVQVLEPYRSILRAKQGGSIARSKRHWDEARNKAKKLLPVLTKREKIIVLVCLYWSEGSKAELNFINSDPMMVRAFVDCLLILGIQKESLKFSLRIYSDLSKVKAVFFWSDLLEIPRSQITFIDILEGKKKGKLKYGMCRVKVSKGGKHLKLIKSMIDLLKIEIIPAAVVQRIEQGTPKP